MLTQALLNLGFNQSWIDYFLFTKKVGHDTVVILIYVDDLLITGNSIELINEAKHSCISNSKSRIWVS